jgi:hypothetical protein
VSTRRPENAAASLSLSVVAGLLQPGRDRLDRGVADHRADARRVVELLAVGLDELLVLGRIDRVPRVAGDHPVLRRLAAQRIEVFGLAGQQRHDLAPLEQAARIALAHELAEVGGEQAR